MVCFSKEKLEHHSRVHQEGYHEQEYECKTCGKRLKVNIVVGVYVFVIPSHAGTNSINNFCNICSSLL